MKKARSSRKKAPDSGERHPEPAALEARFRAVFAASRDAIGVTKAGVHLFVNPAYLALFGFPPDAQLAGTPILDLVAPESREQFLEHAAGRARGAPAPEAHEMRGRRRDGAAIDLEVSVSPYREEGEELTLVVLRDVTERKRIARESAERGATLRQIMDTASVAIFLVDRAGRITHANRRMAEMFGRPLAELVGSEYVDLVHPAERETGRARMLALLASEIASVDLERRYWRPDGTEFWGHLAGRRFHDVEGAEIGLIGVVTDIDTRKRAMVRLQESEERYRQLFEAESDAIFLIDNATGRILMANSAAVAMYGFAREELLAMRNADLSAEPEETRRVTVETPIAPGTPVRIPLRRHRRKDGTVFPVEITGRFFDYQGRPVHIAAIRDITERRQLEEERLKSQKLESLGTLAGGIAHDFNNLLQGVFGNIALARAALDAGSEPHALLARAELALRQSVSLTSQLLTFSKGGRPVKRVLALGPVIDSAAGFALSGSRIAAALAVDDDLATVEADEGQLGQVLQNIVLNAAQAMPAGGAVEITARNVPAATAPARPGMAPGAAVEIRVTDQGAGIPPECLPRIFDPYFTTKERGSGLGLATAYSIVRNHGGAIAVSSTPGTGSTFSVYLPASGAPVEQPAVKPARPLGRRARVLVMDDEEVVRDVLRDALRALGHEAVPAAHGEEALARYREALAAGRPFDLVILDLTIRGGTGGVGTIRALREIDPAVTAVVSSGYAEGAGLADYRSLGFKAFLKKPFLLEELRETLDALLG